MTLKESLKIVQLESTENNTYCPIILGSPWSSLSMAAAPILNAFDMGLISPGATSVLLSDTNEYPYFYRYLHESPSVKYLQLT